MKAAALSEIRNAFTLKLLIVIALLLTPIIVPFINALLMSFTIILLTVFIYFEFLFSYLAKRIEMTLLNWGARYYNNYD